ncbi:MAG TPA: hypothetical protein VLC74_03595 [Rhizomicrobium sp.]|nr:hypothetical protein [Rhizomicrobium sp.]
MSKFRVKLKLQGFELEMEGTRDELPAIGENVGRQLANFISPSMAMIEGEISTPPINGTSVPEGNADSVRRRTRRRRSPPASGVGSAGEEMKAIIWQHDSQKHGSPSQSWNTATKAIWTLYVASEVPEQSTLTSKQIADTFNKHFKQAGMIMVGNVTRDLGNAKLKKPSPVGEDATHEPSGWFLTDEGRRQAQQLVASKE